MGIVTHHHIINADITDGHRGGGGGATATKKEEQKPAKRVAKASTRKTVAS